MRPVRLILERLMDEYVPWKIKVALTAFDDRHLTR